MILPFMDQAPLFESLDLDLGLYEGPNKATIEALGAISSVLCPSDSDRPGTRPMHGTTSTYYIASMPATSYSGSSGAFNNWSDSTSSELSGGFFTIDPARPSSMATITDGTSNVIAVGEKSYKVWTGSAFLGVQHSSQSPSNPGTDTACCQDWFLTYALYPITNRYTYGMTASSIRFGSQHQGGAHFVFADGAVRFISEQIDHILDKTGNACSSPTTIAGNCGCLWSNSPLGCANGNPATQGVFRDKARLADSMGIWQRLHHKSDELEVSDF